MRQAKTFEILVHHIFVMFHRKIMFLLFFKYFFTLKRELNITPLVPCVLYIVDLDKQLSALKTRRANEYDIYVIDSKAMKMKKPTIGVHRALYIPYNNKGKHVL